MHKFLERSHLKGFEVYNNAFCFQYRVFDPHMILVLLWRRAPYAGCLARMLTEFATALIWQQTYGAAQREIEIYNLPLAFVTALIVNIIVSLLTPRTGRAGLA